MAQYFTDFSEYTVGASPSDWTIKWNLGGTTAEIVTNTEPTGKSLLFENSGSNNGSRIVSWDEIPAAADVEILCKFRASSISNRMGVFSRATAVVDQAYRSYWRDNNGGRLLIESPTGDLTNVSDIWELVSWKWHRLSVSGNQLKLKAWLDGDPEPATWDSEVTNTEITAGGFVGLFISNRKTSIEADIFSVGTNGDIAPSSAPATGPNTPINPSVTNLLATSARLNWEQG